MAAVRARLIALGATPHRAQRLQRDVLVDTREATLAGRGCALRVRDDGGHAFLTFKGAVEPGPFKMRQEIETAAGGAADLLAILAALGYHPVFRYEKYREELTIPGALVAIDETPIGAFLEIEGEADAIRGCAERLGFAAADYLTASYRSLYLETPGRPADGDMTFAAFAP